MNVCDSINAACTSGPIAEPDGRVVFEFHFSAEDAVFAGHFPGRPVLPGVYQLEMTRVASERALQAPLVVREVVKAKFLRPIAPKEPVRLELKLTEKAGTLQAFATFSVFGQPAGETLMRLSQPE